MPKQVVERGELLTGQLGTYAIRSLIDRGGVGAVYDGQRIADKKRVAVKLLHGGRFPVTAVARERFRREIVDALKLKHPRLVETYDFGRFDEHDFLVMEYVSGGTVASLIRPGRYDDATALRWCSHLLEGVAYLHSQGYIHRDLKPNNLLLTESGNLKIGDLGIVRDLSAQAYLTMTGDQIGSVLYISRHQRENPTEATVADDAHAVACCLYEILSRHRIHVYPEHLGTLAGDRFPVYLCDLIMGCLAGYEPVEALAEITRLLRVDTDGTCTGIKEADRHEFNTEVFSLGGTNLNVGLQRKRLAHAAPLTLAAELTVSNDRTDGPYRAVFLTEDLLMVTPELMNSYGQYVAQILRVSDHRIEKINSISIEAPFRVARDSRGRLVTACSTGVRLYEADDGGGLREAAAFCFPGIEFHAMTMAASQRLPLVAVGEWCAAPMILNTHTGQWRRLQAEPDVDWNGLGATAFLGERKLILQHNHRSELFAYEIDLDADDRMIGHWPFPRELSDIAASERTGAIFACHRAGLECLNFEDGGRRWAFFPSTCVSTVVLNPAEPMLAIIVGLLDGGRVALIETEGGTMAFLPDTGDADTLRMARYVDWSPSGTRLCVSDRENCISVFSC